MTCGIASFVVTTSHGCPGASVAISFRMSMTERPSVWIVNSTSSLGRACLDSRYRRNPALAGLSMTDSVDGRIAQNPLRHRPPEQRWMWQLRRHHSDEIRTRSGEMRDARGRNAGDHDIERNHFSFAGLTIFASRKMTHLPSGCLRRIDNTGPRRRLGAPPPAGWIVTVS